MSRSARTHDGKVMTSMSADSDQPTMSIGALSKATGIPVETLRTWERRYAFPDPERNESGHRVYRPSCVERLRLIDEALQSGHRPSNVVDLPVEDLRELLNIAARGDTSNDVGVRDPQNEPIGEWLLATRDFDSARLEHLFRNDWMKLGALAFLRARVGPFLFELGAAWAERRLAVAHEHFASERLRDFLSSHWRPLSDRASGPTVVCATLPGESHSLGLQMTAVVLALAGLRVVYLGTDAPPDDILEAAREREARAIVVSISVAANRFMARRDLSALREKLADDVELIAGGLGAPEGLPAVRYMPSLDELADWAFEVET